MSKIYTDFYFACIVELDLVLVIRDAIVYRLLLSSPFGGRIGRIFTSYELFYG